MPWEVTVLLGGRVTWTNTDPKEEWWLCRECRTHLVNLPSKAGSVCPNNHGGIVPALVKEVKRVPEKSTKGRNDVSMLIGQHDCGAKGWSKRQFKNEVAIPKCSERAVLSVGGVGHCWGCCEKAGVNPKEVLGADWRSKLED